MADRVLRDEIWESERYLDLQTDTQRLAFIRLLAEADDFGNLEGGTRRIYRLLTRSMHCRTPEEAAAILTALSDVDLIRFYTFDDNNMTSGKRELIHIPRLRTHRQYLTRKVPESPWCNKNTVLGKTKRAIKQGLAADVVTTKQRRSNHVSQGVGVGVGVGVGEKHIPAQVQEIMFAQFWAAYPKKKSKGDAEKKWAKLKTNEQLFATIMQGLSLAKNSVQWTTERGKYIPNPATWLNAKGWEDEHEQRIEVLV